MTPYFRFLFLFFHILFEPLKCEDDPHYFPPKAPVNDWKRRNFLLHGVPEPPHETLEGLKDTLTHVLNDVMNLNLTFLEIDNFYRVGEKVKPGRTIVVRCLYDWKKEEIFAEESRLEGSGITIEDDTRPMLTNATHSIEDEIEVHQVANKHFYLSERRNFILYGVDVQMDEGYKKLKTAVSHVVNSLLKVKAMPHEIFCYRVAAKDYNLQPILVKCLTQWRRNEILSRKDMLSGTKYRITVQNEDVHCT